MFQKVKLIPMILSAALLVPFLAGCGSDAGSDSTTGSQNNSQTDDQTSANTEATTATTPGTAPATPDSIPGSAPASGPDTATPEQSGVILEYGDTYSLSGQASVADPAIAEISGGVLKAKAVGQTELTLDGETVPLTVNPAVVDVVLFTGQSNMVGRETSRYSVEIPEGQAYEFKYLTTSLDAVKNPVGETFGEVEISSGSSLVPQFCADYVASGRKIVAVHVARGGRSITYFDSRGGAIYQNILQKYGACIEYLEENPNFTVGRRFYVMYQGESDTNHGMSGDGYKTRYNRFHNGMITNLGMEFGAMIANGRNSDPLEHEGIVTIQQTKTELALEKDDLIMADVSPYNWYITGMLTYIRSDLIHLNAEGLKIVGSEACKNILNYMGLGDPALAGVDPVTYLEVAEDTAQNPPEGDAEGRSWDFSDGSIAGATFNGTITPKIENGKYINENNNYGRYRLDSSLTLSASRDFEIEWSGKAYSNMSNNASILLSNGAEMFLTFQAERGVYLRCGENRFDVQSAVNVSEIYKDHVWKLVYSAEKHQISVYLDGTLVKTGSWSSDLTFTDLLGCTNNQYTFVGELDYLKITVG